MFSSVNFFIVLKNKKCSWVTFAVKQKHAYLVHTGLDIAFNGTVVNRALSSLHGESLKIALTVPFKSMDYDLCLTIHNDKIICLKNYIWTLNGIVKERIESLSQTLIL